MIQSYRNVLSALTESAMFGPGEFGQFSGKMPGFMMEEALRQAKDAENLLNANNIDTKVIETEVGFKITTPMDDLEVQASGNNFDMLKELYDG